MSETKTRSFAQGQRCVPLVENISKLFHAAEDGDEVRNEHCIDQKSSAEQCVDVLGPDFREGLSK